MATNLQVNLNDKRLYEHLRIIITQFEKAALNSQSREGFLAAANGPLTAMDSVLESVDAAVGYNESTPEEGAPETAQSAAGTAELEVTTQDENGDGLPEVRVQGGVSFDADLEDILGGGDDADESATWLKECLGCDLRVQFSWQLQPIDLLGPVAGLLGDINIALDSFEQQMNPFQMLDTLCDMLNNLRIFCIPDLTIMLKSLTFLMKKYLTFGLEISLDWTTLIGPLLKLILDGIASLITQAAGVILAPLDCAEGALRTFESLERELSQAAGTAAAVGQRIGDRAGQAAGTTASLFDEYPGATYDPINNEEIDASVNFRDVVIDNGQVGSARGEAESLPDNRLSTSDRRGSQDQSSRASGSFATGVVFEDNVGLPDALNDPKFGQATWSTKMILALKEAKKFIMSLVSRINGAVRSLENLVGGGLSLQLGNLGLLLFIKDMVALITMIIQLLRDNEGVEDWCEYIQANPEALRPYLANFTNSRVSFEPEEDRIGLFVGPNRVGEIKTCLTERTGTPQSEMLDQWIADLKRGGSS